MSLVSERNPVSQRNRVSLSLARNRVSGLQPITD
ncbi:hypothetical protein SPLC1_S203300 [Arthrospira platensis C1]|nr:hypothetical protein SPLC1_S203300 [Arthrospira platensis C1]